MPTNDGEIFFMLKKLLTAVGCAAGALLLASCGTVNLSQDGPQGFDNTNVKSSSVKCETVLTETYDRYNNLKSTAGKQVSFVDWSKLDDLLASAVSAHQNGQNGICVENSKKVLNYIQRDKNYIAWKKSLTA
jgi:hypothetical protein